MTLPPPQAVVAVVGLAVASYTDVRTGLIPNNITGPMMLAGLLIHTIAGDPLFGVLGLVAAFVLHFPLWLMNIEKGGDAKLLMGLGACVGWVELIEASLWYAIVYIPAGLLYLAVQGRLGNLKKTAQVQVQKAVGIGGEGPEPTKLKTAPVIALAGLLGLVGDWLRWVIV